MIRRLSTGLILMALTTRCTTGDKYDINEYYQVQQQDSVKASILTYVFIPPPYTSKEDRFKPEHRGFYSALVQKFPMEKYFIADDGTNYFLMIRPGPSPDKKRAVGGHFKVGPQFRLTGFREEFVTPLLSEKEVSERGAFLFEEMVKGTLGPYLGMKMYVQWPNEISDYDTVLYEWKLDSAAFQ